MATRKLTFTLPQELATRFLRRVPPSRRSQYVASAIATQLREREEELIRICEAANNSADILDIEKSFNDLKEEPDGVQEPW